MGTQIIELDADLKAFIYGQSFRPGAVDIDDLILIEPQYINFDKEIKVGRMIVNKVVAKELADIFDILFAASFPIRNIDLIEAYNNSDDISMAADNSYSLSVRYKTGRTDYSKHAFGLAVDINPLENPYIKEGLILPPDASTDRSKLTKGMIVKGDVCQRAFEERGWTWGGDWQTLKDYHHFEKP